MTSDAFYPVRVHASRSPLPPANPCQVHIAHTSAATSRVRLFFSRSGSEAPPRHLRAEGRDSSISYRCRSPNKIKSAGQNPTTTSLNECCCVPFPARWRSIRQAGQPSPSHLNRIEKKNVYRGTRKLVAGQRTSSDGSG